MKKRIIRICMILFAMVLLAIPVKADSGVLEFNISGYYDYTRVQDLLDLINEERAEAGLSPVSYDQTLSSIAMERASECAVYFSDTRPDGTDFRTIFQYYYGYSTGTKAENIATDALSAAAVMKQWMDACGNCRNNILDPSFTSVGIGCFYQDEGTLYWTVLFNSETVRPGTPYSYLQYNGSIPISITADRLDLYYDGASDCAVELYQGTSFTPRIYLKNRLHKLAPKLYLSGGYTLSSSDNTIATTSGTTINAVAPGEVKIRLYLGVGSYSIPHKVIPKPELSYRFDGSDLVVTMDGTLISGLNAQLYYIDSNDSEWVMGNLCNSNPTYKVPTSYLLIGHTYIFVIRYFDTASNTWVNVSNQLEITIPLPAPTGVTASTVESSGNVQLNWSPVSGAYCYEIYRSTSKNGKYTLMNTVYDTTYVNKTGNVGTTYYYKVVAVSYYGVKSLESTPVSRMRVCAQPTVTASNSDAGKVKLTWKKVNGAQKYQIWRATSENGEFTLMKTVTGTSYVNNTAKLGKTYYYKVVAIASKAAANSVASAVVTRSGTLAKAQVTVSTESASGKPKLTWNAVEGAVSYKIYRSTQAGTGYSLMKTVKDTTYVNLTAKAGTTYYYKVIAVCSNTNGNSRSAAVSVTCKCAKPVATGSNVAASGKPRLTWAAVDGAVKYQIYRSDSKNGKYTLMSTVTGTAYTNKSAVSGKTYYYKVKAIGETEASNSVMSAAVKQACVDPVINISQGAASVSSVTIKWTRADGIASYTLYRSTSKNGTYKKITKTTDLSYADTSVKAGKTYYYKVVGNPSASGAKKVTSEIISVKAVPGATTMKKTAYSTASSITVTWKAFSGADGYRVFRRAVGEEKWTKLADVTSGTKYIDKTASGKYQYCVAAYQIVSGTKYIGYKSDPIQTRTLTAVGNLDSRSSVYFNELTWSTKTGATGYTLAFRPNKSSSWTNLGTVKKVNSYVHNDTFCQDYYYRVRPIVEYDGVVTYGPWSSTKSYYVASDYESFAEHFVAPSEPQTGYYYDYQGNLCTYTYYLGSYEAYYISKDMGVFGEEYVSDPRHFYASDAEARKHMVTISVKVWDFTDSSHTTKTTKTRSFTVHENLAKTFELLFAEIYACEEKYVISDIGGYCFEANSEHTSGLSVDINVSANPYVDPEGNVLVGSKFDPENNPYSIPVGGEVEQIFAKYGFTRGIYWYSGYKDYMHFSFYGT